MEMSTFLTALFTVLFFVLAFILIGLYLMSRLVGGFGNLRAIYRLFTGKGTQKTQRGSAKSASSGNTSRTHRHQESTQKSSSPRGEKMFGQNEGTYVEFEEVKE